MLKNEAGFLSHARTENNFWIIDLNMRPKPCTPRRKQRKCFRTLISAMTSWILCQEYSNRSKRRQANTAY